MVAGVFVRVFIAQPTFQLADPAGLTKGLVSWIYSNAGQAWSAPGAGTALRASLLHQHRQIMQLTLQGKRRLLP